MNTAHQEIRRFAHVGSPQTEAVLTVGLGGVRRHGCVALADGAQILGVCELERVTRIRGAGFNPSGMPDEALDLLLSRAGRSRRDVKRYAIAEQAGVASDLNPIVFDHHEAHASAAYLSAAFNSAAIVICDHEPPHVSVWKGDGRKIERIDWPWSGHGFSDLYSRCAAVMGFDLEGGEQRFEALARLAPPQADLELSELFSTDGNRVTTNDGWREAVAGRVAGAPLPRRAAVAAALQQRLGELLLEVLTRVRQHVNLDHLCLGGSLFYHSSINTLVRSSGLFARVFVPVNPGNAGLAVGSALRAAGASPTRLSPFLGPAYGADEIKATLDNCKLPYYWTDESEAIGIAVEALQHGRLVGWFEGAMEWGPRALGARSILASPFAPYVLENLNTFLKRREPWRGYALSVLKDSVANHFSGPEDAPFMECDYRPLDPQAFRHVLPAPQAAIRVQTTDADTPRRFRQLLQAFGEASGIPALVNTSFNGFHEPIVCTPRDAVRVFYGSGLDILLLDSFVLTK